MIAYIPRTFHSVPAYYARSTTTVRERFIDAYCTYQVPEAAHPVSLFKGVEITNDSSSVSLTRLESRVGP